MRQIVYSLNEQHIASPRSDPWSVSALYCSPGEGSGVLNNALYIGRLIWNRSQWLKDPDTGKRQRAERPKHEWKIAEVPELRIVDDEIWTAVRTRRHRRRENIGKGRGPRTLLGGLMRCPYCDGAIVAADTRMYGS